MAGLYPGTHATLFTFHSKECLQDARQQAGGPARVLVPGQQLFQGDMDPSEELN